MLLKDIYVGQTVATNKYDKYLKGVMVEIKDDVCVVKSDGKRYEVYIKDLIGVL